MTLRLSKLFSRLSAALVLSCSLMTPVSVHASNKITVHSSSIVKELKTIAEAGNYKGSGYNGFCLRFVANFWSDHGATRSSSWSAIAYGHDVCESTTMENIPEGADVFFDNTLVHGNPAGHVGIYIGNGQFVSAVSGGIRIDSFDDVRATVGDQKITWGDIYYGWGYHSNVKVIDDIDNFTVEPVKDQIYSGEALTPNPVVKVNGKKLKKDKDYKLTYSNNTKLGTAKINIVGINDHIYDGGTSTTFKIVKRQLKDSDFILTQSTYTYSGEAIEPVLTKRTKEAFDVDITYKNNVEPGIGTIIIKGKGECKGVIKKTFLITNTWDHVLKTSVIKQAQ